MKIIASYFREILIFVLVVICLLSIGKCSNNRKDADQANQNTLNIRKALRRTTDSKGRVIVSQGLIIAKKNSELAKQIEEIEGLRNIREQIKIETKVIVKQIEVPIDNPIYIYSLDSTKKYLQVPVSFYLKNEWYFQYGTITSLGTIHLDSLGFITKPIISIGIRKKPFLKRIFTKQEPTIAFRDDNPFVQVTNMSNIVIENKLQRRFGIGCTFGYGITNSGLSPFIGLGLQYNLISF